MSTQEENKATFRRYIEEVWNQSNLEVVDEIFDRYISHQPDGPTLERGPEDVKRFVSEFRAAFPDLRINIDEQVAEGDKVMIRATFRGTPQRVQGHGAHWQGDRSQGIHRLPLLP